ncbi:hypothetical protein ScPMuIL_018370 [Solemya velum]
MKMSPMKKWCTVIQRMLFRGGAMRLKHIIVLCIMAMVLAFLTYEYVTMQTLTNINQTSDPRKQYQILYRYNTSLPVGFNDSRVPSNIESLKSNDQRLIDVIRDVWIEPPSSLPYHFNQPDATLRSQLGQDKILDEMMKYKTHRFFLEAGSCRW